MASMVVAGGIVLYLFSEHSEPRNFLSVKPETRFFERKSTDPDLENKVVEIASRFVCSCGRCNEEKLTVCTCPTAQKERQFIRDALLMGDPVEAVTQSVNATFGWMKKEG